MLPTSKFVSAALAILMSWGAAPAARAQDAAAAMTEHPAPGDYRLSAAGFQDAYGFNDTARAVINLYYAKWKTGLKIMRYAGYPVPVATALGRHYEPDPRTYGVAPNYSKYYYDPWVAPVAFSLLGVSAFGFIKATLFNRRALYEVIRQYRATRRLPAAVRPAALRPYLTEVLGVMAPAKP